MAVLHVKHCKTKYVYCDELLRLYLASRFFELKFGSDSIGTCDIKVETVAAAKGIQVGSECSISVPCFQNSLLRSPHRPFIPVFVMILKTTALAATASIGASLTESAMGAHLHLHRQPHDPRKARPSQASA